MRMTAVLALALDATGASAQWVKGADTLSAKAVADSQAALSAVNAAIRKSPNDAALRFRAGRIAWVLAIRDENPPAIRSLNGPMLRALADSSFRLAVQIDPRNPEYRLTFGRFLRASSDPVLRLKAPEQVDAAVELSRMLPDTAMRLAALFEAGRLNWLEYDTQANQIVGCYHEFSPSVDSGSTNDVANARGQTDLGVKIVHNQLVNCQMVFAKPPDPASYAKAEALFRETLALIPSDARAFRHLSALLAERSRWAELAAVARDRIRRLPNDGAAWLALGLALHRDRKWQVASAVFDTALSKLTDIERARQFSFTRLLSQPDSLAYASANATGRADRERTFWGMVDPLWSREGNDPRSEFLARVTFSDLRWTVEELGVRGADSDRGKVMVRYGPPTNIAAVRGCYFRLAWPESCTDGPGATNMAMQARPASSDVVTYWDYDTGFTFVFWGAPTYGTARIPVVDGAHMERMLEVRSAGFDNVASERLLPMPVSATRFRAATDSLDLLVLAQAPVAAIKDSVPNAVVRTDTWLLGRSDGGEYRDSTNVGPSGLHRSVYRVPIDQYMYRIEATASGSMVAGRATTWIKADRDTITGFTTRGFGVSDLLLATAVQPGARVPVRWRDFNIAPLLGELPRQRNLDLIWENYDIGARGGRTEYVVTITLQRVRSAGGRIAASILGLAANAVGVDRTDDRVTFKFDRVGPAAPSAFVERVSIAMGDTPGGDYRLTLEVADKISGRKATAITALTIAR